jgi:hypothetical protein
MNLNSMSSLNIERFIAPWVITVDAIILNLTAYISNSPQTLQVLGLLVSSSEETETNTS